MEEYKITLLDGEEVNFVHNGDLSSLIALLEESFIFQSGDKKAYFVSAIKSVAKRF